MTPKLLKAALGALALAACAKPMPAPASNGTSADAAPEPVEWIGYHGEAPLAPADFHALASGLVGADAQAGKFVAERELMAGVFVTASADPATPQQARLAFSFDEGKPARRALAQTPASFSVGAVFIATVEAALATMQSDNAKDPGSGESFFIEYRVQSAQGGRLSFGVKGDRGAYALVLDVTSPHASLSTARLGQAADAFAPTDSVAGTVSFHMSKDEFDYFTDHAYGKGATGRQNFKDFALVPHTWLRLTVEPHLADQYVDVGFDLITTDAQRVAVAKAPASIAAGDAFRTLVDRSMGKMLAAEKAAPGSSTPWTIPFYYDNPDGGGVVQVLAHGAGGRFSVDYAVESPRHTLVDVPFLAFKAVKFPPPPANAGATCDLLGDPNIELAPQGVFQMTFTASDVVKNSPDLKGPLKGTLYCSLFHASDVLVTGPLPGAVTVQDFNVPDADLGAATPPTFTSATLYAGDYQVLCAQDLDHSGGASKGDPVTLPIGSYPLSCNTNPITVEFALLDPQE